MSISEFLFGGPKYDYAPIGGVKPGMGQTYIDSVYNFNPFKYGGGGLGRAGRWAREDLNDIRDGKDISQIGGFAGTLGAIKSNYAANNASALRDIAADPTTNVEHPELVAAKQAEYTRGASQDEANTTANAASGFYSQQQNLLNQAFQNRAARLLQAARDENDAKYRAAGLYFDAHKPPTGQSKGFLGVAGGIAGALLGGPAGAAVGSGLGDLFSPQARPSFGSNEYAAQGLKSIGSGIGSLFKRPGSKYGDETAELGRRGYGLYS